jgi:trehalose 6-phosphate synthase
MRKDQKVQTHKPMLIWRSGSEGSLSPLIVVSNRAPIEYYYDDEGGLRRRLTAGGVATALTSISNSLPVTWVASACSPADRVVAADNRPLALGEENSLRLVAAPAEAYDLFYNTFCNPLLWFVQHSLNHELQGRDLAREALHAWEHGYLPVNQAIAEAVAAELQASDGCGSVMLHDYHLYAAPLFIRNLCPEAALQHFVHVPWPCLDAWQQIPRQIVDSIVEGLLATDSLVFQTESSAQEFLLTCWALFPQARVDFNSGSVIYRGHHTRVWANPMSVDVFDLRSRLSSPEARPYFDRLEGEAAERTIVRIDRLDPSKNIHAGLEAFDLMLRNHPEWLGRVTFLSFLVPSRTEIPEYRDYGERVFSLVKDINARHGRAGWTPVKVFYEHDRLQSLVALSLYDVLLVNSVADGMNLVSKEGPVLNRRDGAMLLSVTAGSYQELREGALAVWPDNVEGTADALHRALNMTPEERRDRATLLRRAVLRHDFSRWLELQLEDLTAIESIKPAPAAA